MSAPKTGLSLFLLLLVVAGALAATACSGTHSGGGKRDAMLDCEAAGNSSTTCRKWIGE
jgi:hypothetical protein